jgi:phosphoribosyl-AMP cyclohydrolase
MKKEYTFKKILSNGSVCNLKTILLLLCVGLSNITNAQCTIAINGLYPPETFTSTCTGTNQTIVVDAYASEYSNVNIQANKTYTFTSSVATDFVTITNAAGTVVFASGTSPLLWSSGANSGVIRYFLHLNSSCSQQDTDRIKYISCQETACTTAEFGLYPNETFTPSCTGSAEIIANDSYASEYSNV